jgi:hypothetical protein
VYGGLPSKAMKEPKKPIPSIQDLPDTPAVYAMYAGRGQGFYCAYVGVAGKLKQRVLQHLVRRDSSVTTGVSAVVLRPEYITEIRWWEHPDFMERHVLEAAELVAFDVLEPILRSRGAIQEKSRQLHSDEAFRVRMKVLFEGEPSGRIALMTLQEAFEQIAELEHRVGELERLLRKDIGKAK